MRNAKVLDTDDVKRLIAEKFNVDVKDVIKSQYSFTVILEEENNGENNTKGLHTGNGNSDPV